jgi:hypothetical protein
MPVEKAPGPDRFTRVFYKTCWGIIKHDVLAPFQCIYNQVTGPLPKLNGAFLTLLPKDDVSEAPSEFRPISLIHSFAKLISKVLALWLAPHMDSLVSTAQSAFIKRRVLLLLTLMSCRQLIATSRAGVVETSKMLPDNTQKMRSNEKYYHDWLVSL